MMSPCPPRHSSGLESAETVLLSLSILQNVHFKLVFIKVVPTWMRSTIRFSFVQSISISCMCEDLSL